MSAPRVTTSPQPGSEPVIVGVGSLVGRPNDAAAPDAVGWMTEALRVALSDAAMASPGAPTESAIAAEVGWIGIPEGTWRCSDAGAVIAGRLGLGGPGGVHSVRADVGILQQRLIAEACEAIARGEVAAAAVVGGEARARDRAIAKLGGEPTQTAGPEGVEPDEVIHPADDLMSDLELERDLATPAAQYAIVEDALAYADGLDRSALRRRLGDLWAGFAAVAADNPTAWDRSAPSADVIVSAAGGNRMVAEPYTRSLCSQWNVDAASALVLMSAAVADRLDVPAHRRVAVEATAESNLILPLPQRAEPHRWPAFEAVAEALASHLGVPVAGGLGADEVDLYACFPSAVQVQARALGLPLEARALTVTGGMTFSGGPLNNAMLASTVAVVDRLRRHATAGRSARGLVTSVSGMLTKPGAMTLRSGGAAAPFVALEVTDEASRRSPALAVDPALAGPAVIDGATVVPTFEGTFRAVALVSAGVGGNRDVPGKGDASAAGGPEPRTRSVATSDDPEAAASVAELGGAGRSVVLDGAGGFAFAP
ncbi:MAG: hypothetical protein R2754_03990 [Microthrixaceae bacterium]